MHGPSLRARSKNALCMSCPPGEEAVQGGRIMKSQRLLIALTVVNLGLLALLLAQTRIYIGSRGVQVWTNIDTPVLRGRGLQIVDGQGRIRASINLYPADPT